MSYKLYITAETTIYQNEVKCRVLENDFNYSQNPSVFVLKQSTTGQTQAPVTGEVKDFVTGSSFHPYATTIGLYNEVNELLAVGKLATPYPIPSNTDITFIVKWDS